MHVCIIEVMVFPLHIYANTKASIHVDMLVMYSSYQQEEYTGIYTSKKIVNIPLYKTVSFV